MQYPQWSLTPALSRREGPEGDLALLFPLVDNQKTLRALSGKFRDFRKSTLLSALYAGSLYASGKRTGRRQPTPQTGFQNTHEPSERR